MAKQKQPRITHVRASKEKVNRVKKIARQRSAQEDRDVTMADVIDEILEEGLAKREVV